ncbi:MAG: hypothetical protein M0C28_47495 [Candidatus Moduliflexus flocculans]|nr:hypothetical protein [Candidatus Moduliflexus flocculans]
MIARRPGRRACIPERVTHNDTKLNNVMIDDAHRRGRLRHRPRHGHARARPSTTSATPSACGAATAAEDERDLAQVGFDLDALRPAWPPATSTRPATSSSRPKQERLAFSAKLLTLECGIRFLTDHLKGDVYFKVHRPKATTSTGPGPSSRWWPRWSGGCPKWKPSSGSPL